MPCPQGAGQGRSHGPLPVLDGAGEFELEVPKRGVALAASVNQTEIFQTGKLAFRVTKGAQRSIICQDR
jgi:hypothetical protein